MGNKKNSFKNERLRLPNGSYRPAYLCEGIYERDSREIHQNNSDKTTPTASNIRIYVFDSQEEVKKIKIIYHK